MKWGQVRCPTLTSPLWLHRRDADATGAGSSFTRKTKVGDALGQRPQQRDDEQIGVGKIDNSVAIEVGGAKHRAYGARGVVE